MWTTANRPKYNRDKLRYPSNLTGEEWAHIAPLIPPAKHGGRKRKVDVREVVNGIMYALSTGCFMRSYIRPIFKTATACLFSRPCSGCFPS